MTSEQFIQGYRTFVRRQREADAKFWAVMRRRRLDRFNREILAELEHGR